MPTLIHERLREFAPLFNACKDRTERHLLCTVIREGVSFNKLTEGFHVPYNVTDLVMADVAKSMRRPRFEA